MGVDAGDFDNDGDEDLFITELTGEGINLYVNDGRANFEDASAASGLGAAEPCRTPASARPGSTSTTTAGSNPRGQRHHRRASRARQARDRFPAISGSCCSAIWATGGSRTSPAGPARCSRLSEVGRGAAFGDIDNDGDIDVLVGNDAGRVRLLINNIGNRKHWLGSDSTAAASTASEHGGDRLPGRAGRACSARASDRRASGGPTLWRRARSDGSYASANDPRVLVGLGDRPSAPRVQVQWPDGRLEEWPDVAIDRWTTLKRAAESESLCAVSRRPGPRSSR